MEEKHPWIPLSQINSNSKKVLIMLMFFLNSTFNSNISYFIFISMKSHRSPPHAGISGFLIFLGFII